MDSSVNQEMILKESKAWIEKFVIGLNICPFAGPSFLQDKIAYEVLENDEDQNVLEAFLILLSRMLDQNSISNSFLILSNDQSFVKYLDLYHTCEDLLGEAGTDQLFQLASFHPKYQYDGIEYDDLANYRNRSPYAMIHMLRAEEVEQVIEAHKNTLEIPEINTDKLRALGREKLMHILHSTSPTYKN